MGNRKFGACQKGGLDMEERRIPRIMIAAPASGSGKTMVMCGLLQLLKARKRTIAFKCGPDYIDPMFHQTVLGIPSRNLDAWLAEPETLRRLLAFHAEKERAELCLIEGVMGYYDGLGISSEEGSSCQLSVITQTPVVLVVDTAGAGLSTIALIQGFLRFRPYQQIRGVILNRCSKRVFDALAPLIEEDLCIAAIGYIPGQEEIHFPGRHLGLMLPEEIRDLHKRIRTFAQEMERTLDIERFLKLAEEAAPAEIGTGQRPSAGTGKSDPIRLGLAKDEAFCFYYEDNLDLLQELGAELVPFSPIHDTALPAHLDGLYMGGGYPELHARELSENRTMHESIAKALQRGIPCLAECGAFMYLHEEMEDIHGHIWPMASIIPGKAVRRDKLVRFGYCELTAKKDTILGPAGICLRAHEFHYWDSSQTEGVFAARKPGGADQWNCMYSQGNLLAGFPHLYFPGRPETAAAFVDACRRPTASAGEKNTARTEDV